MINESWKPIVGYEGLYEVSDQGRVRSLSRKVSGVKYGKPYKYLIQGRIMTMHPDQKGYLRLELHKDGKGETKKVHRLVAEAFIGDITDKEIDHINTIRNDNRAENLKIVTAKENANNPITKARHAEAGKTNNIRGVTAYDLKGKFVKSFISMSEAERQGYGKPSGICNCLTGLAKTHNGYQWKNNITI